MTREIKNALISAHALDAGIHGSCWGEQRDGSPRFCHLELRGPNDKLLFRRCLEESDYYEAVNFWLRLRQRAKKAA
jgi:hypothetical protein